MNIEEQFYEDVIQLRKKHCQHYGTCELCPSDGRLFGECYFTRICDTYREMLKK